MPVSHEMKFAFMLIAIIQGIIATANIPDRTATGGAPYSMLDQYRGCGTNVYSVTNTSAARTMTDTPRDGNTIGVQPFLY